jgi:hypothetical protein
VNQLNDTQKIPIII